MLFCTAVKYMATSSLHEDVASQVDPVSGDEPGMLQGEEGAQIWMDLTGSASAGPNVVGTATGVLPLGVAVGVPCGVPVGWAVGEVVPCATGLPVLRLDSTLKPTMPSSSTMMTATAAGTSHGGRSARMLPPTDGRGTERRTAGGVVIREGGAGVGTREGSVTTTPLPSGSAGTASPGRHTGCSSGVHVGCSGARGVGAGAAGGAGGEVENAGAGAAGAGAGGEVENAGAGAAGAGAGGEVENAEKGCSGGAAAAGVSQVGTGGGLGGDWIAGGSGGASTGGGTVLAAGAGAGGSAQVGTLGAGGVGAAGAGGSRGAGGAGAGGNVIAGIDG